MPGQSFTNYVDFGDPIGNFGFHFGTVDNVGPAQDLVTENEVGDVIAAALFHPLSNYKTDLNLGPSTVLNFNSNQTAQGTGGNDSIVGIDTAGNDNDIVYGHQGDDIITFNNALSDSTLYGGQGNDTIEFTFRDVLYGNKGDDIVIDEFASPNSTGISVLYGGQGDDTLVAFGAGDDTLYGGIGNNLFVSNSDLGDNTAIAADQLTTVGVWHPANDLLSMSQVYGTGVTGFDLVKESDWSATSPDAALMAADTFYESDHAHTFLLIYGGSENGVAADYLFYDSDNNVSPGVASDGMILIGDNAAGDLNNGNIVNSRFA
jgi:Ca2+-binding RTX toxin-like protein